MVGACHRRGIKVIALVTTVDDARAVEATGLDAVVAQGAEAGGHRSHFNPAREKGETYASETESCVSGLTPSMQPTLCHPFAFHACAVGWNPLSRHWRCPTHAL